MNNIQSPIPVSSSLSISNASLLIDNSSLSSYPTENKTFTKTILMKNLLTACTILLSSFSFGQYYSNVGPYNTPIQTNVGEMDFVISESGTPYVFYIDGATNKGNVKYWDGSAWVQYGTADFTLTNISDLDIEVYYNGTSDKVMVAMRQGGTFFEAFYWTGTTWFANGYWDDGFGPMQLSLSVGWDFDVEYDLNGNGVLMIANASQSATGYSSTNGTSIWQQLSTFNQAPMGPKMDLEFGPNGNSWCVSSLNTNNTILVKNSGGGFSNVGSLYSSNLSSDDVALSAYTVTGNATVAVGGIKVDPGPDEHFLYHAKATQSGYQVQDVLVNGTGTWDDEFDVVAWEDYTYYINRKGSNVAVIQINNSTNAVATTHTNLGVSGMLTNVEIELNPSNHYPVIAFIDANSQLWVRELWDSPAIVCDDPNPSFCSGEGGNYGDWIILNSDNLDNTEIGIDVVSDDPAVADGVLLGGGGWWDLDVTAPHSSTTNSTTFTVSTYTEDGNLDDDDQYDIITLAKDSLINNLTVTQMCTNAPALNLNNLIFPNGGEYGHAMDSTGIFDPMDLGPGTHNVYYEQMNATGCLNVVNQDIVVSDAPIISVSAGSSGCNDSTGTASVTVTSGGTAPFTYYWTTGADSVNLSGLPAGSYTVTVSDNNGCITTGVANIQNSSINLSASITDLSCAGGNTGSIDMTVAGTGPYDILWSNGYSTEDLTGLAAGSYDVTVEDANGCVSTETYTVTAPNPVTTSIVTTNATCGNSDGGATSTPAGGTPMYTTTFYDNQGTSLGSTLTNAASGSYSVEVIDDNGCSTTQNFVINETGGPTITLNSITNAGCTNNGAIDISTTGTITSINWSNGETTEDITGLAAGLYTVTVTDNGGCSSLLDVQVNPSIPTTPEICLVTVDSVTTKNLVVWEKEVTSDISHYNIYREGSQTGVYVKVDSVLYSEDSEFIDHVASPMVRSWRYKLSSVNNCGVESNLSPYHKTIHATINVGLGGNYNIHWDAYEGITYSTWSCWRYTALDGYTEIWNAASNIFSYTDTPPSTQDLDYVIGFPLAQPCTSSLMKAQDYNGTRSNRSAGIFNGSGLGLEDVNTTDYDVTIFPNPNNGEFRIHITGVANGAFDYVLMDMTGKVVDQGTEYNRVFDKNYNELEKGVYFMTVSNNGVVNTKKVVIQ